MSEAHAVDPTELARRAMDSSMDGMAILDLSERYRYVNPAHARLYGYDDPEDLVGTSWRRLYDEATLEWFDSEVMPELSAEGQWRGRAVGRRRDGETFPQELSLSRTPDGGIICVVRDVSDRVERQETLERHETVLENIHDAVYTLDPQGRITWVNQTAIDEFDGGYDREELIGSFVSKVLDEEDIEKSVEVIQDLIHNENRTSGRCEVELRTADGDRIPAELNIALLPYEDGEFQGTVGVARDLRGVKRREQRLSVLNRVLRHNLRNSMQTIMGQSALLARQVDEAGAERIGDIRRESEELIELSDKARLFAEAAEADGGGYAVDAVEILAERCAEFEQRHPAASIALEAPEERQVVAGRGLAIAVENLLENAVEHNAPGVDVTVAVDDAPSAGDRVRIEVRDDGQGIPPQEVEVIEHGEETPLRHGSGLGLWLVSWLVESYGGQLSFESETDTGTVVALELRCPP